jgi:hypothetical protein
MGVEQCSINVDRDEAGRRHCFHSNLPTLLHVGNVHSVFALDWALRGW